LHIILQLRTRLYLAGAIQIGLCNRQISWGLFRRKAQGETTDYTSNGQPVQAVVNCYHGAFIINFLIGALDYLGLPILSLDTRLSGAVTVIASLVLDVVGGGSVGGLVIDMETEVRVEFCDLLVGDDLVIVSLIIQNICKISAGCRPSCGSGGLLPLVERVALGDGELQALLTLRCCSLLFGSASASPGINCLWALGPIISLSLKNIFTFLLLEFVNLLLVLCLQYVELL